MTCYLLVLLAALLPAAAPARVLCYYDSRSHYRAGAAKFQVQDIEPSLTYCTHLVYGYAVLDATSYKLTPQDEQLETVPTTGNFLAITGLKKRFPGLHVMLSVGCHSDLHDHEKYLTLLESEDNRKAFVGSARTLLRQYGFDGLDLCWQFPPKPVKKDRGALGSIWHGLKKTLGYAHSHKDEKEEEHRDGFSSLVEELKKVLKPDGLLLTATALTNTNAQAYLDTAKISQHLDAIVVMAFDYKSPEAGRSEKEADYPAPLYPAGGRPLNDTVDGSVRAWLEKGVPSSKLILGMPTYGRTWKLTSESQISGVPPLTADGPGPEGPQTKMAGLLAYPEICPLVGGSPRDKTHLRLVTDPSRRLGTYAFRLPDAGSDEGGLWVGYEDPDTAGLKATYAKQKGLGGIAVFDLTLDDFRGVCSGDKFPILKSAKSKLA
ncbi:chitinase-like protein EN03 [Bacillus rossius redtenbacheri]|uniref:chitinase-like protein EN03 n=1 Tax=Bacillus rossius redtenbacheri TaxID=93214 RepID=UPI002FDE691B